MIIPKWEKKKIREIVKSEYGLYMDLRKSIVKKRINRLTNKFWKYISEFECE